MSKHKYVWRNGRTWLEHRVVWEETFGPIPEGMLVHHLNGNAQDNRPENLALMTRRRHFQTHPHPRRGTGVGRMEGSYYSRPGCCRDCGRETKTHRAELCRSCAAEVRNANRH